MSTVVKWGLITGMVYVVFSLISNMMGMNQGGGGGMGLNFLILAVLTVATFFTIFLGVKETREDTNGYITLGQAFMTGFKIALIAALISAVFTILYGYLIDPDLSEKILSGAEEQWDEMNVPEENRDTMRKWSGYMANPVVLAAISLVSVIFWGVIKSLVAGLILKKDPPVVIPPANPDVA